MKIIPNEVMGEKPRADMYLPGAMLGFAIFLAVVAVALAAGFAALLVSGMLLVPLLAVAAVFLALAALAFLCWKNQAVRIVDESSFEVTTFLGKTKRYFFSEITGAKENNDSYTIFVGKDKVHVESIAVVTERFFAVLSAAINQRTVEIMREKNEK